MHRQVHIRFESPKSVTLTTEFKYKTFDLSELRTARTRGIDGITLQTQQTMHSFFDDPDKVGIMLEVCGNTASPYMDVWARTQSGADEKYIGTARFDYFWEEDGDLEFKDTKEHLFKVYLKE